MASNRSILPNVKFNEDQVPLFFLIIAIAGFGLFANRLGYYQDDWPYVFYAFNKGIPSLVTELYYDSRPNAAWLYMGLFNLLGFNPLFWQITAVLFRWLTATTLWYFLKRLWPDRTREATFVSLVFLVHPFFLIQSYAVNSMLYWSGFLFFALSLYLMMRAIASYQFFIPFTVLAVLLEGLHLFTSEYFAGMTLIRPLILYWVFSKQFSDTRTRIIKTALNWFPYLAALTAYIIWRIFLYIPPPIGDRNSPELLYALFRSPITTIRNLTQIAIQDSVIVVFTSWQRTFAPELFSFATRFNWFVLLVAALLFLAVFAYLKKNYSEQSNKPDRWLVFPLILGVFSVLLSMIPLWIIGQNIIAHKNEFAGSRFGIGATFGASLIFVVIIENLLDNLKKKFVVVSLCVALAIAMHLTIERGFIHSWEKQERLARELLWRAPKIEFGTAIVTDEEILGYMGSYSVSYSLITTYQLGDIASPPYWYFPFYYTNPNVEAFLTGIPLEDSKLTMNFSGSSQQMILLSFNPEMKRCLWILQPQDTNLRLVNDDMRKLSAGSDIDLIKETVGEEPNLPEDIYGKQDTRTWCYFFEKADLARQYKQWDIITKLWQQAQAAGEQADNGFEYIPFIEGFGHTGNWEQAKLLTKSANKITAGLEPSLCSALNRLTAETSKSDERDQTIQKLKDDLKCSNFE